MKHLTTLDSDFGRGLGPYGPCSQLSNQNNQRAYIIRYGAFGDHIHATHLPRLLKEKCGFKHITLEHNLKGIPIWANNPWVDEFVLFDPYFEILKNNYPYNLTIKRLDVIWQSGNYDKVINLQFSLEYSIMAMETQNNYYRNNDYRRKRFDINFYDQTTIWAGYPEYTGTTGELYFTEKEENIVRAIFEKRYKGKFVILLNLSGSNKQKIVYNAEKIIKTFLTRHKDAVCITMGDKDCQKWLEFKGDRIINKANIYPYRQSLVTTKYVDMVLSGESGLPIASTLLGIPTIQLMTCASIKNHGGCFPNDYSLQSPIYCSPCHKGPYEFIGCPSLEYLGERYPKCIKFDVDLILSKMEEIYAISR